MENLFNKEIPPKLKQIIEKALEKECDTRYQHASEIRVDLARVQWESETGGLGGTRTLISYELWRKRLFTKVKTGIVSTGFDYAL